MNNRERTRRNIYTGLLINAISLSFISIVIFVFRGKGSSYLRFGPHPDLMVISIHVDTWFRWSCTTLMLSILGVAQVYSDEVGQPVLGFSIYNPDKLIITEFNSRYELQVIANTYYLMNAIRSVLFVVVWTTQIDIALVTVLAKEVASIYTIRLLLESKTFTQPVDDDAERLLDVL